MIAAFPRVHFCFLACLYLFLRNSPLTSSLQKRGPVGKSSRGSGIGSIQIVTNSTELIYPTQPLS